MQTWCYDTNIQAVKIFDTVGNLTGNIFEAALGFMVTFKSYYVINHLFVFSFNITYKIIPDSLDNVDGATKLLLPKKEKSKTGPQDDINCSRDPECYLELFH